MFALLPAWAGAETQPAPIRLGDVSSGSLLVAGAAPGQYLPLPAVDSKVDMHITGPLARTTLVQTFKNPSAQWVEAVYAFPLPETAAVDHMDMIVGERIIEGQIQEKQAARKTYQQAKRDGKKTALVEQHRPNLFSTSVANIPPHATIRISLQYQQMLTWRDKRFSLRFPMAITPRYAPPQNLAPTHRISATAELADGWSVLPGELPNRVPLDNSLQQEAQASASINVTLDAGFALDRVDSDYHEITQTRISDTAFNIKLTTGQTIADRDFVLSWQPRSGSEPGAAFFSREADGQQYALLMLMPADSGQQSPPESRDVQFIIDTSGSMGGESIRQARASLAIAVDSLTAADFFNVIEFNSSTQKLFSGSRQANTGNKRLAMAFIEKLEADGGTEMLPALQAALANQETGGGRLRQVVFITDGAVSNEQQLLAYIQSALKQSRLFTIGIGSAPNSYFMTEAAYLGRGTHTFISRPEEVGMKMQSLLQRIAKPVLTDLVMTTDVAVELLPQKLPDLYAGEPVVVAMHMKKPVKQAKLSGRLGSAVWQQQLTLGNGQSQAGLEINWGREKIHQLMRSKIAGADSEQIRQSVIDVAMQYHLVSKYTSLVAVDVTPARPADATLAEKSVPANKPAGLQMPANTLSFASGATDSRFLLLAGLLLITLALLSKRFVAPAAGKC